MHWVFSFNSVIFLTAFLLGTILTIFIAGMRKKERHTWLLTGYFAAFTVMVFTGLVAQSVPMESLSNATVMVSCFCLLAPFLLQFAYHFPSNVNPRESRGMLIASVIVVALSIAFIHKAITFGPYGFIANIEALALMLPVILAQVFFGIWTIVVWIRKIFWLERDNPQPWWRKILWPESRHARAMRSFILVFALTIFLPAADVLQVKGIITQEQQYSLLVGFGIIIFALFFVVYINQFPEQSSLMSKLLGACLLLVLPFLIREGYRADKLNRQLWDQQCLNQLRAYQAHLTKGHPWQPEEQLKYVLSYSEQAAPSDYRLEWNNSPWDLAWFEGFDRETARRQRIKEEKFNALPLARPLLTLRARTSDRNALMLNDHPIHFDFIHEGRRYEMGFAYLDYRKALTKENMSLARVQVSAILVAFLFFPVVFRRTLVRPLKALIYGVSQAQGGNLNVVVETYARDELGYLARSFNAMVKSFRAAQERIQEETAARMKLAEENARKDQELEQARKLQLAMLPQSLPDTPDLEIAVFMRPATEVGGDYYDFWQDEDGTLIVGVGDATGHGLQAGTMVAATKSLFNAMVHRQEPLTFLADSSQALADMGYENMYMALMIARIQNGHVTLTSAGMPYATVFRAESKTIQQVRLPGLPLGSTFSFPYKLEALQMNPGDVLLLQSDGLEERFNENNEMFGEERVKNVFAAHAHLDAETIVKVLVEEGENWGGSRPQDDDITLVVLKHKAA